MTLVDSSVWIDFLKGKHTLQVNALRELLFEDNVLVGDLMLVEVLQGARTSKEVQAIEAVFGFLPIAELVNIEIARKSAANYRFMRSRGSTVRKTIDVLIGTYCIKNSLPLLFSDRDFRPMIEHLGLSADPASAV